MLAVLAALFLCSPVNGTGSDIRAISTQNCLINDIGLDIALLIGSSIWPTMFSGEGHVLNSLKLLDVITLKYR